MTISEFHFLRPYCLLALLPITVFLILLLRRRMGNGLWSAVCDEALLPYLLQGKEAAAKRWPLAMGAIAAILAALALAGPTWQRLPAPAFRNSSALVIALDLSDSMDAQDIKPSRLIRARYKISDLLKQRKDGQTALLVFAGDAFVVTPLTDDTATIDSQLQALATDIMPSKGRNVAAALSKAVALFKQAGLPKGQILLVTDGIESDNALGHVDAEYKVSVLGVGTADGAPIALPEGGFLKDNQGRIVVPKLNGSDLSGFARAGGGIYQSITANDADIQTLQAFVNQPVQQQGKENSDVLLELWDDKGPWLLLLVLPLAAMGFRKGWLGMAFLLLLPLPNESHAFEWQDLWQNKNQRAQQAYSQKDYAKAAERFDNPDWKAAAYYQAGDYGQALKANSSSQFHESSDGLYNQGNALAKSGQLEAAVKAYEKALAKNPDNTDAKYNKDLVEKALEQQKQQEQQKQEQQQGQDGKGQQNQQGENKENSESSQAENGQKPEQKPERHSSDDNAEQQQAEKQDITEQKQQNAEAGQSQKAEPGKDGKAEAKAQSEAVLPKLTDEQEQANEQWLNRIPDDPSGLLRRKFKYQYSQQRGRQP